MKTPGQLLLWGAKAIFDSSLLDGLTASSQRPWECTERPTSGGDGTNNKRHGTWSSIAKSPPETALLEIRLVAWRGIEAQQLGSGRHEPMTAVAILTSCDMSFNLANIEMPR